MEYKLDNPQFAKVKQFINVTWDYEDEQILDIMNEGVAKIETICGTTDFLKPFAFSLLKEYSRYSYNGAKQFFEENFQRELLQLQINNALKT